MRPEKKGYRGGGENNKGKNKMNVILNQAIVERQGGDNCSILLASLAELIQSQASVFIFVHHSEYFGNPFFEVYPHPQGVSPWNQPFYR